MTLRARLALLGTLSACVPPADDAPDAAPRAAPPDAAPVSEADAASIDAAAADAGAAGATVNVSGLATGEALTLRLGAGGEVVATQDGLVTLPSGASGDLAVVAAPAGA